MNLKENKLFLVDRKCSTEQLQLRHKSQTFALLCCNQYFTERDSQGWGKGKSFMLSMKTESSLSPIKCWLLFCFVYSEKHSWIIFLILRQKSQNSVSYLCWAWNCNFLALASQRVRITGVHHQFWLIILFLWTELNYNELVHKEKLLDGESNGQCSYVCSMYRVLLSGYYCVNAAIYYHLYMTA